MVIYFPHSKQTFSRCPALARFAASCVSGQAQGLNCQDTICAPYLITQWLVEIGRLHQAGQAGDPALTPSPFPIITERLVPRASESPLDYTDLKVFLPIKNVRISMSGDRKSGDLIKGWLWVWGVYKTKCRVGQFCRAACSLTRLGAVSPRQMRPSDRWYLPPPPLFHYSILRHRPVPLGTKISTSGMYLCLATRQMSAITIMQAAKNIRLITANISSYRERGEKKAGGADTSTAIERLS